MHPIPGSTSAKTIRVYEQGYFNAPECKLLAVSERALCLGSASQRYFLTLKILFHLGWHSVGKLTIITL